MCCCTCRDFVKWCKKRVLHCWVGCKVPDCIFWGLCRCPHGPCYTVVGVLIAFGACWMNMYVIMSCKFMRITELNPVTGEPILSTKRGYGLIARELAYGDEENYRGCILYPDDETDLMYDFWLKWARNLAFLGGLLGLIVFTCLFGACCFLCEPWNFERWLLWCSIWASVCMAMTNLIFGNGFCSDNECKVSYGTGYSISAWMAYLMLANQVKSMGQPPPKKDMPEPGGREDDLWYDHEDERFLQDDEDEDDDDNKNREMNEFDEDEAWQNENDDDKKNGSPRRPWQRRRRRRPEPIPEEGSFVNNSHDNYDEMQEYMEPEDKYVPSQDADFLQRDKEHQDRLYQQKAAAVAAQPSAPQPMPRQYPYAPPQQPAASAVPQPAHDPFLDPNHPPQSQPSQATDNPYFDDESIAAASQGTAKSRHPAMNVADNDHQGGGMADVPIVEEGEDDDTTQGDGGEREDFVDEHDLNNSLSSVPMHNDNDSNDNDSNNTGHDLGDSRFS